MATNGSKWQLFGNILAADWRLMAAFVAAIGSGLAAKWQQMPAGGRDALGRQLITRVVGAIQTILSHRNCKMSKLEAERCAPVP
jgi:hypothetical protein